MKQNRKSKPAENDLFGEPVKPRPPLRKIVARPEGQGFDIAVRQPGGEAYVRLNAVYDTRAEAGQALRDGIGLEPRESREVMSLSVKFRGRRCIA